MAKYRVKKDGPTIIHGHKEIYEEARKKGKTEAEAAQMARKTYNPGDVIELSELEAKRIGGSLETIHGKFLSEHIPTGSSLDDADMNEAHLEGKQKKK